MSTAIVRVSVGQQQSMTPLWFANHETGDTSQWAAGPGYGGGVYPSGTYQYGVQQSIVHRGSYASYATIDTRNGESGVRYTRRQEPSTGADLYYSAWYYVPKFVLVQNGPSGSYWNIYQFKARPNETTSPDPILFLNFRNLGPGGALRVMAAWRGDFLGLSRVLFYQEIVDVPIAQWFHLEGFLHQAGDLTGRFICWQDGVKILDLQNIQTRYASYDRGQAWSVNHYSDAQIIDGVEQPSTLYFDGAVIARERVYGRSVEGM